jgi:glycosyltransferase involved in cell wall biosynthesis
MGQVFKRNEEINSTLTVKLSLFSCIPGFLMKNSVLFLTNAYPDFDSSYRAVFIKTLAHLLQKEGYKISIVTPKIYRNSHYSEEQNGIKVYRFPFFAGNKLLIEYRNIPYLRMLLYYVSGFFLTVYGVLKNQCELIHVHWAIPTGLIGIWVGRLLRKPVIVTIHGSDFRMATERSSFLTKIFLYVCQRAKQIMCVSELQKKEIQKMGVRTEKILTFPMGVEESFLDAGRNRGKKLNGQLHTVLSNRNLLPLYNVSLLIRAIPTVLKEEPNTRFFIAGDGPERETLKREAKNLNVSSFIEFLGRVPHEKMANLLAKADIYVSTSLYDGTSVSLLEAMGSGTFPIVTDIPANREWIKTGQNGFLAPPDEEKYLANRIIEAIRNEALLEKSRIENLSIIEEKALWPVSIKKVKKVYSELLK